MTTAEAIDCARKLATVSTDPLVRDLSIALVEVSAACEATHGRLVIADATIATLLQALEAAVSIGNTLAQRLALHEATATTEH